MEHLPSPSSLPQEQADDAAAAAAQFWPEFGRRWRWTRQQSLAPVYTLIGQMTVALLRSYPAIQHSNQALWYQRSVRDTPAIYALFPEEFIQQAKALVAEGDAREIEGKQVVSFLYLAPGASGATEVVKTLLASTATEAPYYRVQLAHELLNCFCATSWDGRILRSGLRRATWGTGSLLQRGGALNDLLIDTQLLDFLPQATDTTRASLMEGMLGPYWQIIERFAQRLEQLPTLDVLFGRDESILTTFEHELERLLNLPNAVAELDRLLVRHDWQGLQALLNHSPA